MPPVLPLIAAPEPVDAATVHAGPAHRDEAAARLEACLPRLAVRRRAQAYVDGLRSETPRKNGGPRAEVNGDATPDGVPQQVWHAVGSALYAYVRDPLGDTEGVAILDETSFRKKGVHAAGGARPYSGTAGQIANGQVGVFRAYAGSRGYTLGDWALSLPLRARAQTAGRPMAWVTGDAGYGSPYALRTGRERQSLAYVRAVPRHVAALAEADGPRRSAGAGTQGERGYDGPCVPRTAAGRHRRLFRRALSDPDDGQAYAVGTPIPCDLATWVRGAGTRGHIASAFARAKQEVGLDGYEVRSAQGGYRHVTLALWARALLRGVRAAALPAPPPKKRVPVPPVGPPASGPAACLAPARGRDPASAGAPGAADAGRWAAGPGWVPRARPPPVGRHALPLPSAAGPLAPAQYATVVLTLVAPLIALVSALITVGGGVRKQINTRKGIRIETGLEKGPTSREFGFTETVLWRSWDTRTCRSTYASFSSCIPRPYRVRFRSDLVFWGRESRCTFSIYLGAQFQNHARKSATQIHHSDGQGLYRGPNPVIDGHQRVSAVTSWEKLGTAENRGLGLSLGDDVKSGPLRHPALFWGQRGGRRILSEAE